MIRLLRDGILIFTLVGACGLFELQCLPPPDGCTPLTMRCNGSVAEICDGESRWGAFMSCDDVAAQSGGVWVCCATAGDAGAATATCVRAEQCSGGAQ